jgi:hypothetical protein
MVSKTMEGLELLALALLGSAGDVSLLEREDIEKNKGDSLKY